MPADLGNPPQLRQGPVNVALVGVGAWGSRILAALERLDVFRTLWACDPLQPVQLGGAQHAPELSRVLQDARVEAVIVATPEALHGDQALAALDAGKYVFVEKPLCTTAEARCALVKHPRASTHLMLGHLLAYDLAFCALSRLQDRIGFLQVHSRRFSPPGLRPGRSAWWTLAPHDLSVLRRLWGAPERVRVVHTREPQGVEATLSYAGGRLARLELSTAAAERERTFLAERGELRLRLKDVPQRELTLWRGSASRPLRVPNAPPLERELRHFARRIRAGGTFATGLLEGAEVVDVLLAGERSLASGVEVELPRRVQDWTVPNTVRSKPSTTRPWDG